MPQTSTGRRMRRFCWEFETKSTNLSPQSEFMIYTLAGDVAFTTFFPARRLRTTLEASCFPMKLVVYGDDSLFGSQI